MKYEFCALSDPGLVRPNNEDSVLFDARSGLAVLADGMGGYNAGEVASATATSFIRDELTHWLSLTGRDAVSSDLRRAIEICVENANRAIFNAAVNQPEYAGMGTTLVLGVFQNARLMLAHLGDSRCYRWRRGELVRLTRDHSLLQEQLDAGVIRPDDAEVSAIRNFVTRALGVETVVNPEIAEHRVENGDIYMMCSDGLTDMVAEPHLAALLAKPAEPLRDKAQQCIALANRHGGRDNISVLLVRAHSAPFKRGLWSRILKP